MSVKKCYKMRTIPSLRWLGNQDTACSSLSVFRVAEDDRRKVGKKEPMSQVTKFLLFLNVIVCPKRGDSQSLGCLIIILRNF